jgi:hypothetical protein
LSGPTWPIPHPFPNAAMPRLRRPGCRALRRYFDQANPLVLHATHASYWLIFSLLGSRTNCIPAKAIAEGLQSQSVKEVN